MTGPYVSPRALKRPVSDRYTDINTAAEVCFFSLPRLTTPSTPLFPISSPASPRPFLPADVTKAPVLRPASIPARGLLRLCPTPQTTASSATVALQTTTRLSSFINVRGPMDERTTSRRPLVSPAEPIPSLRRPQQAVLAGRPRCGNRHPERWEGMVLGFGKVCALHEGRGKHDGREGVELCTVSKVPVFVSSFSFRSTFICHCSS
ncbi:hypothetical protein FB45DRAFT_922171 [Roridomyces roridus]|uniref:Uncharacterized protein n=1 Tax=Roridomyces roridus TaxID=1738132 RepID=A0AAD7BMS5_9AGAR|nr:hypothetical protein FB45DRAFT_946575 [Roridomyces roridus]KAJ7625731.1 hypothetical protein FB45DRAFT_922171 [Roridomyces roridus]